MSWGGLSMFVFYVVFCVWPGMVWFSIRGRCRSLSLIENHTLVAFSHLCFVGDYFLFSVFFHSPYGTVRLSVIVLFSYFINNMNI